MASIPTQEEVLAATRKGQEAMMAAVKTWVETVRNAAPKLPSAYAPLTGKLPKLPTPQDAVANAYHLAGQLLASQRKFAEDLLKATAPLRPGHRQSSPEVPSRSAWQDAVTVAEPKTPAVSAAPKTVESAAPMAADNTAPKAAPARTAAKSTTAKTAPQTTAARRATAESAGTTTTSARKDTAGTSTRKSTAGTSTRKSATTGSARKGAGTTTSAPKGTDES